MPGSAGDRAPLPVGQDAATADRRRTVLSLPAASQNGGEGEVIRLCQVTRRYGDVSAVEALDLSIAPGEFFALLGASGCGKTTTLRLIAGFEPPDRGRILLQGRDVTTTPAHRRPVNTVFQSYALFPHLDVWENVAFGPRSRRLPSAEIRRRVGEALEVVRLPDLARRRPRQLSGGQQQRVALARALVNAPAALLLDEPLAALDPNLRRAMQQELKRIQREVGIAFLLVTHDREEALALSDRLAVMHGGRLEQVGPPRQLYERPETATVATFLGAANLLRHRDGPLRLLRPERLQLSAEPPPPPRQGVQARVISLTFQGPTLEVRLQPLTTASAGFLVWDEPLLALGTADNLPAGLEPGRLFWCHWDPTDTHPLRDSIR